MSYQQICNEVHRRLRGEAMYSQPIFRPPFWRDHLTNRLVRVRTDGMTTEDLCEPQHTGPGEIVCRYCGQPMSGDPNAPMRACYGAKTLDMGNRLVQDGKTIGWHPGG